MTSLVRSKKFIFSLLAAILLNAIVCPYAAADDKKVVVENVHFDQSGNIITISYDLIGPEDANYTVSVKLRIEDDKSFGYVPKDLTGDVGNGHFAGKSRKIVWNMPADSPMLSTTFQFYFEVNAEIVSTWMNPYLLLGGAFVIGGVAIILLSSGTDVVPPQPHLPLMPPGRP
ncbi:MAG: hypothetical protein ACHQQQ_13965 [Bacteroidota bacterium]